MPTNLEGTDLEQRPDQAAITSKGETKNERDKNHSLTSDSFSSQNHTAVFFISTWEHKAMKVKKSSLSPQPVSQDTDTARQQKPATNHGMTLFLKGFTVSNYFCSMHWFVSCSLSVPDYFFFFYGVHDKDYQLLFYSLFFSFSEVEMAL